ncbi:enoyl-CoA hydratase/isomerase family protein [Alteribacillus sp. YIM 98480]|uniref:enoyl-CoA hydratase/isomerase family protein n=1 Tax=Alteribacillus sp. YIM 98480 TaxID=2606599 RepID=UPI00131E4995|nr:enoyl-CoA hydratase-related protein [Alteribacillus sp. YIM 98480]
MYIDLQWKDSLAIITLQNPPVNVLTDPLLSELDDAVEEVLCAQKTRVVIVTAAGEKAFAAGADISQFPSLNKQTGVNLVNKGKRVLDKFANAPFPVLCAMNGMALGGGLELALACDVRIADERAKVGFPETGLGIIPGYGGTQRFARLIGTGKAKELIFSGETITAQEAFRLGAVEHLAAAGTSLEKAEELAEKMTQKSPLALAKAKRAVNEGIEQSVELGQALESELFGELCESKDKQEGVQAFMEKRKPEFVGK